VKHYLVSIEKNGRGACPFSLPETPEGIRKEHFAKNHPNSLQIGFLKNAENRVFITFFGILRRKTIDFGDKNA
jgi:hypothetical protein